MYIKIKTMDGKESFMLTVSKMSQMEDIRLQIKEKLDVDPLCQRLFFRGKQVNRTSYDDNRYLRSNLNGFFFFLSRWRTDTV